VRQHCPNALVPYHAFDEALKSARLGAAIPWATAFAAMPTNHFLLALAGSSGNSAPQIKDGFITEVC
jgi:hypothetical protein